MENVLELEAFLLPNECSRIIERALGSSHYSTDGVRSEIPGHAVELGLWPEAVAQELAQFYGEHLEVENVLVSEMRPSDEHVLHADAETLDGDPNHTAGRSHVGLVYLTAWGANFEGGILEMPELDTRFVPQPGLLVGFPSTRRYAHRVTPIKWGSRWSLAVWTRRS